MTVKYHYDVVQKSDEWRALRCGLLTASEMSRIITPAKLLYAQNEKEKTHLYELAAQRVTKYVEPVFQSFDMIRGNEDEATAKNYYHETYHDVTDCGFITNDKFGFTLGFSPDAIVGDEGILECKSRLQKYQMETIVTEKMPDEYLIQIQSGLMISERPWCDFISYSGGMFMTTMRVHEDMVVQGAIFNAAVRFHEKLDKILQIYGENINKPNGRYIMTERRLPEGEMHL